MILGFSLWYPICIYISGTFLSCIISFVPLHRIIIVVFQLVPSTLAIWIICSSPSSFSARILTNFSVSVGELQQFLKSRFARVSEDLVKKLGPSVIANLFIVSPVSFYIYQVFLVVMVWPKTICDCLIVYLWQFLFRLSTRHVSLQVRLIESSPLWYSVWYQTPIHAPTGRKPSGL